MRVFVLVSLVCVACEASAGSGGTGSWASSDIGGGSPGGAAETWAGGGAAAATDAGTGKPPAEKEPESEFGAPESSPNFVYIPATDADRLVRISGATLGVQLIEVSAQPTVVRVLPNQDVAVVLHRGADDVAIVRSTEGSDQVSTVAVLPHCNALQLDAAGKHALAWYTYAQAKTGEPVGSMQAVSLVRLADGKDESLVVSTGFRPRQVMFTQDGSKALVVTDDGISIVPLAGAKNGDIVTPVPITTKPLVKVEREVQTTQDGVWAVVREADSQQLGVVHLPSKQIATIALPATPTDLDLVPNGGGALVVLRDAKLVAQVQLPAAATDAFDVKLAPMGDLFAGLARVTDDGKFALLYTSIAGVEQVATLEMATGKVQAVAIKKTVDTAILPAGTHKAILVHKPAPGPGGADPTEKFVDDAQGYTLFDLDTGYTKLVLTPVKPAEIALSQAPDKAWFLLPDPKGVAHAVQGAALASFLTVDHTLGSRPEHARFLAKAGVVAVTQTHPSGRVTFLDAQTGVAKTVTGYELNSKVK